MQEALMSRVSGLGERAVRSLVLVISMFLLAGCIPGIFPRTERVDPGVLSDVRGIGKVVAQATTEYTWEGLTTITDIVVLDVGDVTGEQAVPRASDSLVARGWTINIDRLPESMSMDSPAPENAKVYIEGITASESHNAADSKILKMIQDLRTQPNFEGLVVAEAEPYEME
ncbi:hypothetical protein GCM10009555_053220 [Acrocarpospora macrocephala]|uniref:Uncharacterized protein n=1 Tax=Acrocarpospora macrocephala TaxID=150177 RepID=A0A5M3WY63_9ACTN|nr:hypothetical protein [Acrocarpospora macrocephala]GES11018.1 hypothetical protein Amac_046150 [Acrocarpospora macrocephala]